MSIWKTVDPTQQRPKKKRKTYQLEHSPNPTFLHYIPPDKLEVEISSSSSQQSTPSLCTPATVDFPASGTQVNRRHDTLLISRPCNYRDSSNSSSMWKKPPNPIYIPSHPRDGRRGVSSPYNQMSSTLRNSIAPQPGNPIVRAALFSTRPEAQDSERSKLNLPFSPSVTKTIGIPRPTRDTFPSLRNAGYSAANTLDAEAQFNSRPSRGIESTLEHHISSKETEIIEISDEEDLGVAAPRPYPLRRPRSLSSSPEPLDLLAFGTHPGHIQHANPGKGKGNDPAPKPHTVTSAISLVEEMDDVASEPANDCCLPPRLLRSLPAAKIGRHA